MKNVTELENKEEDNQMAKKKSTCRVKKMFLLSIIFFLGVFGSTGSAIADGGSDITLDQALAVVSAAQAKAIKQGTLMDIAVVDAGANLKAFVRMDGAFLGSIDISIKKAKTARFFNMPTGKLGELAQPGKPLFNIEFSNGGLITFPGGLPLKDKNGNIIGAIGVSGSSVEDDHEVALAGAAVLIK
ncbi:MAG: heme-binding protein [Desulfobacterales bacterium]